MLKDQDFDDAVVFMDFERVMSIHIGKKDIFYFTLDQDVLKRIREDENWEFHSIKNG